MNTIQVIFLAVVQGLTEFLPVSSSGHLVIFQHLFGLKKPEVLFDICLHIGTLIAICIVFSHHIQSLITSIFRFPSLLKSTGGFKEAISKDADIWTVVLIITGSIPTAFLGYFFHKLTKEVFFSVQLVGIMLLVTGIILWASKWVKQKGCKIKETTLRNAIIIGFAQGIAVLPGISRSGFTIVAGLFSGVDRETAARYSFLLSIPAILGALVLELTTSHGHSNVSIWNILIGISSAAVVGFFTLKFLLNMVKHGKLHLLAPYCWIIGIVALML